MPPSYLMLDIIVCIPGITGSVPRKNNRDVWNISGGAVLNALRSLGGSLQDLKLEEDPVDVEDVDGPKSARCRKASTGSRRSAAASSR